MSKKSSKSQPKQEIDYSKAKEEIYRPMKFQSELDLVSARLKPKKQFSVKAVWSLNFNFQIIGDNSINSSDEDKIAYLISSELPSCPGNEFTLTPPQLQNWLEHKQSAILLAAEILGTLKDVLKEKVSFLEEYDKECILLEAEYIKKLWYLIRNNWLRIKCLLNSKFKINYGSPWELFFNILKVEFNQRFGICFLEHHIDNPKLFAKLYSLENKFLTNKQNSNDDKQYKELLKKPNIVENAHWHITLQSLELISQNNEETRKHFESSKKSNKKYHSFLAKLYYSGNSFSSTTWYRRTKINGAKAITLIEKEFHNQ